ncbi:MAG: NAD-binding protein, partial [Nevskia sp.]|nr:NAD-binding protein [Nevskia sp.]
MIERRQAILIGSGNLAYRIFQELRNAQIDVTIINDATTEFDKEIQKQGGRLLLGYVRDPQLLVEAGVGRTQTLIVVTPDDTTNLVVALNALELNPEIHIVLRHFNPVLAEQMESSIPSSRVLSPDAIAAAVFAVAAHVPNTLLSFPFQGETMAFFTLDVGRFPALAGSPVGAVERQHGFKVVLLEAEAGQLKFPDAAQLIPPSARLIACGPLARAEAFAQPPAAGRPRRLPQPDALLGLRRVRHWINSIDPIMAWTILAGLLIVSLGGIFYKLMGHASDEMNVFSFVVTVATASGFGDLPVKDMPLYGITVTRLIWFAGFLLLATISALITNAILAKRLDMLMGRSRARKRGHLVLCGLGPLGVRVMEKLVALGESIVVVERNAENKFIEHARALDVPVI